MQELILQRALSAPGERLSIVTPCSRPRNLPEISKSIPRGSEWIIVFDAADTSACPDSLRGTAEVVLDATRGGRDGNAQRNLGLSRASRDFVYFLDDDNIVHPDYLAVFSERASLDDIVVVNQVHASGASRLRAQPPVCIGNVDTAQVTLPRHIAAEFRWEADAPFADGRFFEAIYLRHAARFVFLDVDAAYYNYLDPTGYRGGSGYRVSHRSG